MTEFAKQIFKIACMWSKDETVQLMPLTNRDMKRGCTLRAYVDSSK